MMKKTYIHVDMIPDKINWRARKKNNEKIEGLTLAEKTSRIEKLARKMGIKIGG